MRIYSSKALKWEGNKLYHPTYMGDRYICELIPDEKHPSMFWIEWPGSIRSADYYNFTRARDHAIKLTLTDLNKQSEDKPQDSEETLVDGPLMHLNDVPATTLPESDKSSVRASKREIELYAKMMEEMAHMPREEMGKRQPGERNMYELQNEKNAKLRMVL